MWLFGVATNARLRADCCSPVRGRRAGLPRDEALFKEFKE